jgi:hypothetical protein
LEALWLMDFLEGVWVTEWVLEGERLCECLLAVWLLVCEWLLEWDKEIECVLVWEWLLEWDKEMECVFVWEWLLEWDRLGDLDLLEELRRV